MFRARPSDKLVRIEYLLWIVALAALLYGCYFLWEGYIARHELGLKAAQKPAAETDGAILSDQALDEMYAGSPLQPNDDGTVIGKLEIPSLGLAAPITTGLSKVDLIRGVGHVPGSAMAGGLGNMGLAAHRDTYFRPLRNVSKNADLLVSSGGETYRYRVDETEVVYPADVRVLATAAVPQLTLITCYPFDFIGAAPKRFIVHAHLVSLLPTHP